MDSNYHAIKTDFLKQKTYTKINFLIFLKDIITLEERHGFNILCLNQPKALDYFKHADFESMDDAYINENAESISQCVHALLPKHDMFEKLIKLCNSKSSNPLIGSMIKSLLNDNTKLKKLQQYVKNHALMNMVKSSLTKKSKEDIINYKLIQKLSELNSEVQVLKLLHIQNLSNIDNVKLDEYVNNYRCQVLPLEVLEDEQYKHVYDTFKLFK